MDQKEFEKFLLHAILRLPGIRIEKKLSVFHSGSFSTHDAARAGASEGAAALIAESRKAVQAELDAQAAALQAGRNRRFSLIGR